jgi:succinate dehydrogenase / fumarate reductase membrane anchor subunit
MVLMATGLGRTGLQDWLIQRVTAVILVFYIVGLSFLVAKHQPFTHAAWQQLFQEPYVRYGTLCALISLCLHAWVGMWTVLTDYIKPLFLRLPLQLLVILSLLGEILWGMHILWGR